MKSTSRRVACPVFKYASSVVMPTHHTVVGLSSNQMRRWPFRASWSGCSSNSAASCPSASTSLRVSVLMARLGYIRLLPGNVGSDDKCNRISVALINHPTVSCCQWLKTKPLEFCGSPLISLVWPHLDHCLIHGDTNVVSQEPSTVERDSLVSAFHYHCRCAFLCLTVNFNTFSSSSSATVYGLRSGVGNVSQS